MGEVVLKAVCLDTDILIDHLRGDREATRRIEELEGTGNILSTTAINAFELYCGAKKTLKRRENTEAVRRLLDRLLVFSFDERAAENAGELAAKLEADGASIGLRDVLIGATVIVNDGELMTRNIKHFEKIDDIELIR
ncbi:type II toxin-antitoxin system VapC family toxin [Candidatus Bathyarchaeota archaeon]|nr:type II toxin-antitoxin system VapC family toxin [Candidatus Bathyarchaeota archaeon]